MANRTAPNVRASLALTLAALFGFAAMSPLEAGEDRIDSRRQRYAVLLWEQGNVLHMLEQYDAAIRYFQKSIELHPTAEAHTYLGWSLSKLGRLEDAIAECKKAIPLDPDFGNPYNDIGVYLIELDRPDEAIAWLLKATRAKRYCCYQFAHFNMGRILLTQGHVEEAKRSFERALAYDPAYFPAMMGIRFIREQEERRL